MTEQNIKDEGKSRKYYAEIVHIAQDDLDVYEFRLFCHYKRWSQADDSGACWESTRTTAERCKMSVGKVSQARKSLAEKGFIILTENKKTNTLMVTLPDLWPRTIERYGGSSGEHPQPDEQERSPHEQARSSGEQGVHDMNGERSPHEPIKNQLEEESSKEELPIQESSSPKPPSPDATQPAPAAPEEEEDDEMNSILVEFSKISETDPTPKDRATLTSYRDTYGATALLAAIHKAQNQDSVRMPRQYVCSILENDNDRPGTSVPGSSSGSQMDQLLQQKREFEAQFGKPAEIGART